MSYKGIIGKENNPLLDMHDKWCTWRWQTITAFICWEKAASSIATGLKLITWGSFGSLISHVSFIPNEHTQSELSNWSVALDMVRLESGTCLKQSLGLLAPRRSDHPKTQAWITGGFWKNCPHNIVQSSLAVVFAPVVFLAQSERRAAPLRRCALRTGRCWMSSGMNWAGIRVSEKKEAGLHFSTSEDPKLWRSFLRYNANFAVLPITASLMETRGKMRQRWVESVMFLLIV